MQALRSRLFLRKLLSSLRYKTEEQLRYQATKAALCNASLPFQKDKKKELSKPFGWDEKYYQKNACAGDRETN